MKVIANNRLTPPFLGGRFPPRTLHGRIRPGR